MPDYIKGIVDVNLLATKRAGWHVSVASGHSARLVLMTKHSTLHTKTT